MLNPQSPSPSGALYFDYQATTPVDPRVFEAMRPYFCELFANAHSAEHLLGRSAHAAIEQARAQIGRYIGCEPEDIVFTSGATEANNLAILGTVRVRSQDRDTMLVSPIEHSSVLEAARASGCRVHTIKVDEAGRVDLSSLERQLSERVLLLSIGFVNNEVGTIQDIHAIGELASATGALFHVDGAQALTALTIDTSKLPVDFLSLSSHKAYGPKGIGALYIAPGRRSRLKPLLYGGGQEGGLRAGTLPTPLCVGFAAACELLASDGTAERARVRERRDFLFEQIRRWVPHVELVGSSTYRHPGNLSIRLPVEDARDVLELLQPDLACSTGSACQSGADQPSHVLTGLGLSVLEARRVLRLGVGRFTQHEDCAAAARILGQAVEAASVQNGR